ncbi:RHS repeat-associated core domain-containing protein [Thermodesulfobacteriota bacterium]
MLSTRRYRVRPRWNNIWKAFFEANPNAETGLYYYRARYYNPMQGRFINKDPIGIQDGPNRFIYVGNNPVNMVDPSGEYKLYINAFYIGGASGKFFIGYGKFHKYVTISTSCINGEKRFVKYEVKTDTISILAFGGSLAPVGWDFKSEIEIEGNPSDAVLPLNLEGSHTSGAFINLEGLFLNLKGPNFDRNDKSSTSQSLDESWYGGSLIAKLAVSVSVFDYSWDEWIFKEKGCEPCDKVIH